MVTNCTEYLSSQSDAFVIIRLENYFANQTDHVIKLEAIYTMKTITIKHKIPSRYILYLHVNICQHSSITMITVQLT